MKKKNSTNNQIGRSENDLEVLNNELHNQNEALKKADERINKQNHLYAFINQINQNIVRVKDEKTLFRNACRMALDFGKFKMAWIGMYDYTTEKIILLAQEGIAESDIQLFSDVPYQVQGPQHQVQTTGKYYLCNDVQHTFELENWKPFAAKNGINSILVLPILKSGNIFGTLNLYATELNFSYTEEINLLVELSSDISFALDLFEKTEKQRLTEEIVIRNEQKFRHTLDNMIEGVQMHDFNWRYTYVNDALVNYSTYSKKELMGSSLMEKYPGIEQSDLFKVMERCMKERVAEHLETEFVFPNGTKTFFELSIQPSDDGIFILSVDRSEQKKAKEKLVKVNRLYAFLSAINQGIVHLNDEKELLNNTCNVAVNIGQFKIAWILLLEEGTALLKMASLCGDADIIHENQNNPGMNSTDPQFSGTTIIRALNTGKYAVSNDVQNDPLMASWKKDLKKNNIKASISIPIKKFGKVIGVFGLHSTVEGFFDELEISLLTEATTDISFALETMAIVKSHKETEALVLKNEIKFRALVEKSVDLIILRSPDGKIFYTSPSITKILGYPAEEFLKLNLLNLIHPDDLPAVIEQTELILRIPGTSFFGQHRFLHLNGGWIWCEGTITNMLHQNGVNALVSNFRDISEKKTVEKIIEFEKSNLNALINNTSDLMWSIDLDFKLITFNQPFFEIIKLVSGKNLVRGDSVFTAVLSDAQLKRFKVSYSRAFNGEIFTEVEHIPEPVESWSEISYYPIRKGDEVIGTACHSRDITERIKGSQKLAASEAFNRGVLQSLSSHIAVIDDMGVIIAVNEAWKVFAIENGAVTLERTGIGSNYFSVCEKASLSGEELAAEALQAMRDVILGRKTICYLEYPCHSPTEERWFGMSVLKFENEEPMLVVEHQNITERKLAEKKLEHQNKELTKTNSELDRFVYSVSHDLRSPLTSVLGLLNLIEKESKEPNTIQFAAMIRTSINRLDEFIRNILNYSKNNRADLIIEKIPVEQTLNEIIDSLRNMENSDGIRFQLNIIEEVPFYSDKLRFTTILENLISNAIKYQFKNGVDSFIKVTGRTSKAELKLSVEDNGIGIAKEHHTKIFDMFYRLSSKIAGTGIGLYIVKEIVEKLQGEITIKSKEKEGSTFNILLKNFSSSKKNY